mgnify:FL=1
MSSFLFLLIGAFAALLAARAFKSTKVYMALMLCLSLGFVVGTGIKGAVANASNIPTQELVTAVNPTLTQPSSAVVETVDGIQVMSKEMQSDTVKTNSEKLTQQPNTSEIEDDS